MAANEPGQPALVDHAAAWTRNLAIPSSALAIGAHPDDVEFGCGATLAKWAAAGCTIHHVVLTDGSKGTWDATADTAALALRREDEQREAARRLGRGDVSFLRQVDGELEHNATLVGELARIIRLTRPDVILAHDPWKRYRLHPDHRNAGLLACDAVVAARDPHFYKSHQLASHRPTALLLWEADAPDHCEEVDDFVDTKLHALHAHESQFESTMKATDDAQIDAFDQRVRERLRSLGTQVAMTSAEVFKLISDL